MDSARSAGSAEPQAERLDALITMVSILARSSSLDEALGKTLDATLGALGLAVGGIYKFDEATGELRVTRHLRGVPAEYAADVARFQRGEALIGRSLDAEEPLLVADLSALPEARPATRQLGLRSFAMVPLYARRKAVGVMAVGGYALRVFEPEEVRVLAAVGGLLGSAIDNDRLLNRTRRHLRQAEALWEINRASADDRPLRDLLDTVAREAAILGGGDAVVLLSEPDQPLHVAGLHGERALRAVGRPPILDGRSLESLLGAGPCLVRLADPEEAPSRALAVPLRSGERILGGLVVVKSEEAAEEDDLALLATFAQQVAVVLTKARVRDAEDRRAGQLALVSAASEIAASTLDVDVLLSAIARYIQRSFSYYSVSIYLVDRQTRDTFLAGAAGAAAVMPKNQAVRFGEGIIGWVAEHGDYVLANDVRLEPRFRPGKTPATQAELAVPVRLAGDVVAIINVESDRTGAFDEGDVVAIDAIAAQVASAIRNARLFEEKVRALRNLEIVQDITNVLNSELDLDALLEHIARRSVEAVRPTQMGAVLLYDGESLTVRSSFGYPRREALASVRMACNEGLAGSVFVAGQGRIAIAAGADHGRQAALFREASGGVEPRSALSVPISLPHEKLGVLLLENFTSPEAFGSDALRLAATLANQAAIAIGNALRLRRILELDRQRQEYLSNVSHELRSPLTVVQGYLEALADGTAGEQAGEFLRVAGEQCQRLGRMIDEVLEVSRFERGVAQRHLEWSTVSLSGAVRHVLAAVAQEAVLKELKVCSQVPAEAPPVRADPRLLQLLVLNLVQNAVKFTPNGGRVVIDLAAEADQVVLSVTDTGIGIPTEHHERIFDKFFMVDSSLSRSHGGAGIGLYLAREVATIHGGTICVASSSPGGSRFEVRLPRQA